MKRLCLIVGLCLAHSAFAKTSKKPAQQEQETPREAVEVPRVQDSEYNRGLNQFSLVGSIGFRSPSFAEGGITGSYYLQPNSAINVYISALSATINEKADQKIDGEQYYYAGVKTEVNGSAYGATYRQFLTNSFYVEGGAEYLRAKGVFKVSSFFFEDDSDLKADLGSYQKISAVVHIGNQWQWSSFTLGTSWVGAIVPLSTAHNFEQDDSSELPKSVKEFRRGETESQASLLKFYLGWSF